MKKLIGLILLIIIAGGAYYLISPLFLDKEVNDEFPDLDLSSLRIDEMKDRVMNKAKEVTMDDLKKMVELPDAETFEALSDEAKESIERSIVDKMSGFEPVEVDEEMEDAMSEEAKEKMNETPAVDPVLLKSGTFVNADSFHKGSGEAHVVLLPDGEKIARLEDFRVTNGPDLFVYLVKDINNPGSDFLDLGALKGNLGNQNYSIPSDVNIDEYAGIVIWCRAFSVLFSPADFS